MIIAKEFTEQDKEQLLDMVNEVNEYDADFEGFDVISNIEDYDLFLKKLEKWKHQEQIRNRSTPIVHLKQLLVYSMIKNW